MSRKLKKRIKELCGLDGLSKEERYTRCIAIISSDELKQELCHLTPGLTFKEIERSLEDELVSKPKSLEQELYDDLEEACPEKIDPTISFPKPENLKYNLKLSKGPYTSEECYALINLDLDIEEACKTPKFPSANYVTYTPEETDILINDIRSPDPKSEQEGIHGFPRRRQDKKQKY